MKVEFTLSEILNDPIFQKKISKIVSLTGDFSTVAKNAGFDPLSDFRWSNLSYVDFSYSDIRGYDFRGADLSFAHGIEVLVDDTTNFDQATVIGSIFEKRVREQELFASVANAKKIYQLLKDGDPYSVSGWVADGTGLPKRFLEGIGTEEAAVICQKLVVDDIDLTKRTTLFYHLRKITSDREELRSLVSDFVAFQLDNASVVRAFVKVAGELFARDEFISKTILKLCGHRAASVREVAFSAVVDTPLFIRNFDQICKVFLSGHNSDVRRRFLVETATSLGRHHVLSINVAGVNREVDYSDVLDYSDLLDLDKAHLVRASQSNRKSPQSTEEIIRHQQEVLVSAPVFSRMHELKCVEWFDEARSRIDRRYEDLERYLQAKIDRGYKRSS